MKGVYFVTARTISGQKLFNEDRKLKIVSEQFYQASEQFCLTLHAWVLLPNHYHFLFTVSKGKDLRKVIQCINGGSSYQLNKLENKPGRHIWWNYWDRNILDERDFYMRCNYIHHNPVKHGCAQKADDYAYSSYNFYKRKFGEGFLADMERSYPVIDFTDLRDDV